MKSLLMVFSCGAVTLISGCSTSPPQASATTCGAPARNGATYDPINNVTAVSTNGFTYYVRGNVTNLVVNPTPQP